MKLLYLFGLPVRIGSALYLLAVRNSLYELVKSQDSSRFSLSISNRLVAYRDEYKNQIIRYFC